MARWDAADAALGRLERGRSAPAAGRTLAGGPVYFLPQLLPCFYDLRDHMADLYQIIMVLHPLIIMTESVFQIIPLFFLCIESFIFYFPSVFSYFYGILYIFICYW